MDGGIEGGMRAFYSFDEGDGAAVKNREGGLLTVNEKPAAGGGEGCYCSSIGGLSTRTGLVVYICCAYCTWARPAKHQRIDSRRSMGFNRKPNDWREMSMESAHRTNTRNSHQKGIGGAPKREKEEEE